MFLYLLQTRLKKNEQESVLHVPDVKFDSDGTVLHLMGYFLGKVIFTDFGKNLGTYLGAFLELDLKGVRFHELQEVLTQS